MILSSLRQKQNIRILLFWVSFCVLLMAVCFVFFAFLCVCLQEDMFVPLPLQVQRNQAGYTCITKTLPIPNSKSEIQQISVSFAPFSFHIITHSIWPFSKDLERFQLFCLDKRIVQKDMRIFKKLFPLCAYMSSPHYLGDDIP